MTTFDMIEFETIRNPETMGGMVAFSVFTQLGNRLGYPHGEGQLDRLRDTLLELDGLTFDAADVQKAVEVEADRVTLIAQDEHISAHIRAAANGEMLTFNTDSQEFAWTSVQTNDELIARLKRNKETLQGSKDLAPSNVDTTVTQNQAVLLLEKKVTDFINELDETVLPYPVVDYVDETERRGVLGILPPRRRLIETYCADHRHTSDQDDKRLARRVLKFSNFLEELMDNPAAVIAQIWATENEDAIRAAAEAAIDQKVANDNQANVASSGRRESRAERRLARIAAYQAAQAELVVVPEEDTAPEEATPEVIEENEEASWAEESQEDATSTVEKDFELEDMGELPIDLPWMEGQTSPVTKMTFGGEEVYIIRALSPRLKAISDELRSSTAVQNHSDGTNHFDAMTQNIAKRIAAGVMPYDVNSGAKRVRGMSKGATAHSDSTIWYKTELTNNPARVYFVTKTLGELIPAARESLGEGAEKQCVIVVAETNKLAQTQVLKILTGQNHQRLRNKGSGAV